jgi:protease-4
VLASLHVPPLARLGRARNSEDPRVALGTTLPGLSDLAAQLGLSAAPELRMPTITLR